MVTRKEVRKMVELLTVQEVAAILKVSYETALIYVKQHNLAIKVGRQYRVPTDLLAKHLSRQPAEPIKLKKGR
jgi:excisionase family DNA binding protein